MGNPLFNMMTGNGNNYNNDIISRFQQFSKTFNGDPRQQVQNMLNSGRITQQQYDQAVQKAKSLQKMLGM